MTHFDARWHDEIGIRMAVGAMQRHIVVMVLGRGLRLIAAGCVLGGLLAYVFSRFFAAWMAGAPSMDVTTVGLVCGLLVAVGLAASMVPAIQATRVDQLGRSARRMTDWFYCG